MQKFNADGSLAKVSIEQSNIVIRSTDAKNGYLNAGDVVYVDVSFSEAVQATAASNLNLNIGGTTVNAVYSSGSGTNTITYKYIIQQSDQQDLDGISIDPNSFPIFGNNITDLAGKLAVITHTAIADNFSYKVDTAAPTLVSSSPADEGTLVLPSSNIVLTFSEDVFANPLGGDILIRSAGHTDQLIPIGSSQVTISGKTVVIDPGTDFNLNTTYNVRITSGALIDKAGNAYEGISDSTALNFTTLPPVIDLGTNANLGANPQLILGVQVDNGNWYYVLDRNGIDGITYADDIYHTQLDKEFYLTKSFDYDILKHAPGADTTVDYRFAYINGVYLALPTLGVASPSATTYSGTSATGNEYNGYYDDLLAIWDAYSGSSWPTGWGTGRFWAADVVAGNANRHYTLTSTGVSVGPADEPAANFPYAAFQVFSGKPPIVNNIGITSADGILHSNTLNAGDTVYITVIMSEDVNVVTTAGVPRLGINIGGSVVQAEYVSGTGTSDLVFSYTIQDGQNDTNGISINANSLSLNGGSIRDQSGNNAILTHDAVADNSRFIVDNTAPTLFSATPSNTGAVAPDTNIVLTFNENVLAGTGNIVIKDANGTDIHPISVTDTSQVTVSGNTVTINPATNFLNYYSVYHVEMASGVITDTAGNAYAGISDPTVVDFRTTTAPISLGAGNGQLIHGVQVDGGAWYYYWDKNGDGVANDAMTHQQLDTIFNGGSDTTNALRFATLNGMSVALPTLPASINDHSGTVIGTATPNEWQGSNAVNATYNDLLAVWDAYNGVSTISQLKGLPAGWFDGVSESRYWSASVGVAGSHYYINLSRGDTSFLSDANQYHVALQVL